MISCSASSNKKICGIIDSRGTPLLVMHAEDNDPVDEARRGLYKISLFSFDPTRLASILSVYVYIMIMYCSIRYT